MGKPIHLHKLSDDELLRRMGQPTGDKAACAEFWRRYEGYLTAMATRFLKMRPYLEVEDLVLAVAVKLLTPKIAASYDPGRGVKIMTWLGRIMFNMIGVELKKQIVTKKHSPRHQEYQRKISRSQADHQPIPEIADKRSKLQALGKIMRPDMEELILQTRGLSLTQIGELLGEPYSTVRARVHAQREAVRVMMASSPDTMREIPAEVLARKQQIERETAVIVELADKGLSYLQIAERAGVSVGCVKNRLHNHRHPRQAGEFQRTRAA